MNRNYMDELRDYMPRRFIDAVQKNEFDLNERLKKIEESIALLRMQLVSHSIGVQNVYDEFSALNKMLGSSQSDDLRVLMDGE